MAAISRAIKEWTSQLIDLGGRNTLLHYRDLKVGTLDLGDADDIARDKLLDGHTVTLSQLFTDPVERAAQARRCRAIQAKAKENLEERGLLTLFVGAGMATWANETSSNAVPAAPLLLRPLSLISRGSSGEDFDFVVGDDWEFNPTLAHKFKSDFTVDIDPDALLDGATDTSGSINTSSLFRLLGKQAVDVPGFATSERWIVANLSYAKMPMVTDLEISATALADHPLITALAGSTAAREEIRAAQGSVGEGIDLSYSDRMDPADEFIVLDADASQSQVINLAVAGAHLVVQGPPGTGKSQTIANLVATLVARGKSVLFVAEKRAAIDAVTSRLNSVGLGDTVLDLHEGTASRKKLAADLGRVLDSMSRVPATDFHQLQERLSRRRSELNAHPAALHEPRAPWGLSVFDLQAMALGVVPECRAADRIFGDALQQLDHVAFQDATNELAEWCNLGGPGIERHEKPWGRASGVVCTSDQVLEIQQALHQLRGTTLPDTRARVRALAAQMGLREPATCSQAREIVQLLHDVDLVLTRFTPEVFSTDQEALIDALAPAGSGPSAAAATLFNGEYRAAKRQARSLARASDAKIADLRDALEFARDVSRKWASVSLDGRTPTSAPDVATYDSAVSTLVTALESLARWLRLESLLTRDFDELAQACEALTRDSVTLSKLPRLHELRTSLGNRGLGSILDWAIAKRADSDAAVATLQWVWASSILDQVAAVDHRIGTFDGAQQAATVQAFSKADEAQVASGATRVRRAVAEHAFLARNQYPDQSAVLERNARLRRRHSSVRDLMRQAPDVLMALRPCWVMSPLVVAQLLPSGQPLFDVVVFDEASQIRPADAISALARGRQAIVAGDSRQLPPTTFFDVTSTTFDFEEDDEHSDSYTQDMDSILDAMSALLPPPHGSMTLNWHYRSRDERLIAFSNAQPDLYDWSLTTFPGVAQEGCLRHVLVPFRAGLPGTTDSSSDEVTRVVELIREHAAAHPDKSLGVIAMGIKHAERIQEALRLARRDDPDLDAAPCLGENRESDPFFIKNLERVQGDERDAIILTIGYTKTSDGRMQYRFGPLNQQGGERRLNVAITRAREHMTVVSSFDPEDMDDAKLTAEGAQMLKRYLTYTRSGGSDLGSHAMAKPALNPFELDVRTRLTTAGIPLTAQYGVAGYWIDFAASHPNRPGEMILAIEADGASYHSSPTARARDRLRQTHLERLGWNFHRIWSTDWFRDPEGQTAAALAAYHAAISSAALRRHGMPGNPDTPAPAATRADESQAAPQRPPRPQITSRSKIGDYSNAELDQLCRWILSDTLLRTDDELLDEMVDELGFKRRGSQIVARLQESIRRVTT